MRKKHHDISAEVAQLEELAAQKLETQWLIARLLSRVKALGGYGQYAMQTASEAADLSICQGRKYALAWECLRAQAEHDKEGFIKIGPNGVYERHIKGRRKVGTREVVMDGKDLERQAIREEDLFKYNLPAALKEENNNGEEGFKED